MNAEIEEVVLLLDGDGSWEAGSVGAEEESTYVVTNEHGGGSNTWC
ncbi:hypothetical protein [Streptomyces sp. NBC_01497]|nr:hypothetical protein [Streptomyces sp. NBC_01497]